MTDLEKVLRNKMNSSDDIYALAKECTDIINALTKEKEEQERIEKDRIEKAKAKKAIDRGAYLDKLKTQFHLHYTNKNLTTKDVAILAALCVKDTYPDWTEENIKEFIQSIEEDVKMQAKLVGKTGKEFFDEARKEIDKIIDDNLKEISMVKPKDFWYNTSLRKTLKDFVGSL